jgi:hypothetical protein
MRNLLREPRCWVLAASIACYVAALCSPALLFADHPPVRGITALLWGWWGIIKGDFPWFANPLYFGAVVLAWRGHLLLAIPLSAAAIVVGWRSVEVKEWFFNEAGGTPIAGLGIGFSFWIASFAVLTVGTAAVKWLVRAPTKPAA